MQDASAGPADAERAPDALFITRGSSVETKYPGIFDGLNRMVADGTLRGASGVTIGGASQAAGAPSSRWSDVTDHVRQRGTEFIVLHHYHSPSLPDIRFEIERLRTLPHRPLVALTNGDPFFDKLFRPSFPDMFLQAAEVADVVFTTSMGRSADHLAERAGCRTALWPLGTCQARFDAEAQPAPTDPEFRVVFIGSNNRPRNPMRSYHWYSRKRERLVHKLSKRFGDGFALFGLGWEGVRGWQGPVPYALQQETCRRAEVVVGGIPFSPSRYYLSDRPFNQIASGVPFVDFEVDGVDNILRDGDHWHLAASLEEVVDRCDDLLAGPAAQRRESGLAAAEFVIERHTEEERCRSLFRTLVAVRQALLGGGPLPPPDLSFLLPEVDTAVESSLATRNWKL